MIVWRSLIISGLSIAIVTVPPLRGRLGGGWYDCLKKSLTKHSNLFLPFGKVRMGYPTWNVRMGLRPRVGWFHQTCSHFLSLYLRFIMVYRSICLRGGDAPPPLYTVFCPVFGQARCPSGASTLPNKGKHVAPPGHISFSSRAQYPNFSSHQYLPMLLLQRLVSSKRL